jgi:peptidoglycan/LPS O-acetylase OafA/YrhL
MSTDLIAWVVAIALGTVVLVVGMRRNLSETTRSNLPRFGEDSESATATVGLWEGEQRGGGPLSPRQARWLASLNLLLALGNAADAVLSPDDRLLHAAGAAVFALGAVVLVLRTPRRPSGAPAS